MNNLRLDSHWDGITAKGRTYLDVNGGREAEWHISCIFNEVPADGSNSKGDDVVHVFSLRIGSTVENNQPGFTISYRQLDRAAILRFDSEYHPFGFLSDHEVAESWRTPPSGAALGLPHNTTKDETPFGSAFLDYRQKTLGTYFKALTGSLKKEVQQVIKHFCPTERAKAAKSKAQAPFKINLDRLLEAPPSDDNKDASTDEVPQSTKTVPNLPAAQTRSFNSPEILDHTSTIQASAFPAQAQHQINIDYLKTFALILILGSCFSWICLRCRDPRRRAECLARREERRNKKLYRRAARQHKVKMWFWNLRLRYGLVPNETLSWDEKRTRVIEQENILEDAMTNDIRALRNAHRVIGNVTAAEEGRTAFVYESERSRSRQSMSTLPGYESEGTQPPEYDDLSTATTAFEAIRVADGFRMASAETEFRSDSSVISTSPRISRDGTNSDFDEKFEPISLETTRPAGSGL